MDSGQRRVTATGQRQQNPLPTYFPGRTKFSMENFFEVSKFHFKFNIQFVYYSTPHSRLHIKYVTSLPSDPLGRLALFLWGT